MTNSAAATASYSYCCVQSEWVYLPFDLYLPTVLSTILGLIPQSIQRTGQVTLASLGWCHKSGECARIVCSQEGWWCQYSSAYVVATIMWLRYEDRIVWETHAESWHANWRRLCGCNPAICLLYCAMHLYKCKHNITVGSAYIACCPPRVLQRIILLLKQTCETWQFDIILMCDSKQQTGAQVTDHGCVRVRGVWWWSSEHLPWHSCAMTSWPFRDIIIFEVSLFF